METPQAAARRQQRLEALCAATIRALSGQADLHFRARRLHRGRRMLPLFAPHLHPAPDTDTQIDDLAAYRGAADGLGLRLAQSDPALHARLSPADPVERLLFNLLEQFRVESQVPPGLPGVAINLRQRYAEWALAAHHAGLTETARGMLLYTVGQVCRTRITGEPVVEATEDLIESTRYALAPLVGHALLGLRRQRHDQAAFAVHALDLARTVANMLRAVDGDGIDPAVRDASEVDADRAAFSLLMDLPEPDASVDDGPAGVVAGQRHAMSAKPDRYQVFTRAHDRTVPASALVRRAQLLELRAGLDRQIADWSPNLPRLARELHALLAEPARDGWNGWDGGHEEGHVDAARLAQLVANPAERRLFRIERADPQPDAIVSLLVDCSGSMRAHIPHLAPLLDTFVRALELAGVASELLGFSTGGWNGGRARRDWLRAGSPAQPGRLNEALQIVFKPADSTWRRAKPDIAALLKGDLFREGIDGEAVDWACARLAAHPANPAQSRWLMVVSDGCPMDSATRAANGAEYLDQHLRDVVARHEAQGQVRIVGLGLGLDLSPWYRRSQVLDLADLAQTQGHGIWREVLGLLGRR